MRVRTKNGKEIWTGDLDDLLSDNDDLPEEIVEKLRGISPGETIAIGPTIVEGLED